MSSELEAQGKKYFSDIRLFRYLNLTKPLDAYFNNLFVSEKLLSMISIFEVIFRNKIHAVLVAQYGNDYLTTSNSHVFNKEEKKIVKKAIKEAGKAKIRVLESRILAELTLGFWCVLAEKHNLWIKCLHKIHPNRKNVKFRDFVRRIKLIAGIRNKVAHHERIVKKRPYNINHILEAITDETLLLVDDNDFDFKQYIKKYLKDSSNEVKLIISRIKKTRGH